MYSRTSIIRNLDYPEPRLSGMEILSKKIKISLKMGVSAAVTMDTGMFIFCACADAHHSLLLSIKWVDQGVVFPIRLSGLQLSGMAQEQRCPDNRGSTVSS